MARFAKQTVRFLGTELFPRFAQQRVDEQPAAHADPAVDPPDRELHPRLAEHLVPGKHMLVHAIDERSVEIEEQRRGSISHRPSVARRT